MFKKISKYKKCKNYSTKKTQFELNLKIITIIIISHIFLSRKKKHECICMCLFNKLMKIKLIKLIIRIDLICIIIEATFLHSHLFIYVWGFHFICFFLHIFCQLLFEHFIFFSSSVMVDTHCC